jgi:ribonuclease BN (tRNA processing enzyme)
MIVLALMAIIVAVMWGMAWMSKRFDAVASGIAALDARHFDQLSGVAVGTGGTFENHHRSGPAIGVGLGDDLILVDAGRGVAEALRAAGIPAWQPSHVVLTQLLPENTNGLDDLWLTGWLGPRETPLQILGPPGTEAFLEGLRGAHADQAAALAERWSLPAAGGELVAHDIDAPHELLVGGMKLLLHPLPGGHPPALGVRVEAGKQSLAIATTGHDPDAVVALAEGVDWLWSGALYGASLEAAAEAGADPTEVLQREAEAHLRLEDVGGIAGRARARGLVLIRLRPPPVFTSQYRNLVGETYRGAVVIAEDGELVTP